MSKRILILGATGMLGLPVVRSLAEKGRQVRVLVRDAGKARRLFGDGVEVVVGEASNRDDLRLALEGCQAVHISLAQEAELVAVQHIIALAAGSPLERITYVSATTAREENRWFKLIDVKLRAEETLRASGIPHTVFCPTWVLESLHNFVNGDQASIILGKNPPRLHFFAAADFGRMVAASYDDQRALGKRLFIHGPQGLTLSEALERFFQLRHPGLKVMRLKLWQAKLIARLARRERLTYITRLIAYFDRVGELGDPAEANALLGAPTLTLEQWCQLRQDARGGLPH